MRRRMLSVLLALALVLGLIPAAAAAGEETTTAMGGVVYNLDTGTAVGYEASSASSVSGSIRIRSEVDDVQITTVADGAFRGCFNLKSLTVDEGIEIIGGGAFENCTGLETANLPAGLTEIGASAFAGCTSLSKGSVLPETLETLGARAFAKTKLGTVVIPGSVEEIGESAFERCTALTSVSVRDGVEVIGAKAFAGCGINTQLDLPASVNTISASAFAECTALTAVSVRPGGQGAVVGPMAFFGCTKLATVFLPGTEDSVDQSAFAGISGGKLAVHYGGEKPADAADPPAGGWRVHYGAICGDPILSSNPTCTREGTERANVWCGECGKNILTVAYPIPKTEHVEEELPGYAATCEDYGKTAGTRCAVCKNILVPQKDIPPLNHGGDTDKVTETKETAATCTSPKKVTTTVTCKLCNTVISTKTEEEGDPLSHEAGDKTVTKIIEPTCGEDGKKISVPLCKNCGAEMEDDAETLEVLSATGEHTPGEAEYEEIPDKKPTCTEAGKQLEIVKCTECGQEISSEEVDAEALGHEPAEGATQTEENTATCTEDGEKIVTVSECKNCGQSYEIREDADALGHEAKEGTTEDEEVTEEATCTEKGEKRVGAECERCGSTFTWLEETDALGHEEGKAETKVITEATCTEDGLQYTGAVYCTRCNELIKKAGEQVIRALGHAPADGTEETVELTATCTEPGEKITTGERCKNCGQPYEVREDIGALGHTAGEPEVQEEAPSCTEPGKRISTTRCTECQEVLDTSETTLSPRHAYGEWVVTREATAKEPGSRERTCSRCGAKQTLEIPAEGGGSDTPDDPNDPDNPDKPDKPDDPSEPSKPDKPSTKYYDIDLIKTSHGSLEASDDSAAAGERVTITATPRSGYELDSLRVTRQGGGTVRLSGGSRNRYTFTMPAAWVEVRATFTEISRSDTSRTEADVRPEPPVQRSVPQAPAAGQTFSDVPSGHWAAGEIAWAVQMGYMGGGSGGFDPDGSVTGQQLWMILARITGNRPASMEEAKRWAVQTGFAEGGNPEAGITRQQAVISLYRCAALLGGNTAGGIGLTGFADGATVSPSARGAMSWAVTNGIISGDADGRLNPGGAVSRAQMAAFLYRFHQRLF